MDIALPTPAGLPRTAPAVPARRSAFVAAALGWLLPGLGQLYVGRPLKALLMFVAIGSLFAGGLMLTGYTCVDPQNYSLEFVAHALLGGPTAAAYYLTRGVELQQALPWFEVGRLYAAVAGLLNLVAVCDALGEVIEHNRSVRVHAGLRASFLAERQAAMQALFEEARERELAMHVDPAQHVLPFAEEPPPASSPEEPA